MAKVCQNTWLPSNSVFSTQPTATADHFDIAKKKSTREVGDELQFLFVGWIEEYKGVFELVQAAFYLKTQSYNFHINFVGTGSALENLERQCHKMGLEDHCSFLGFQNQQQLRESYFANDIFVLPSWSEGLPNSMIEAMASGLAVIVSDVGEVSQYLASGEEALVVPPKNSQRLAEAMEELIQNLQLRQKLARNGQHLARAEFCMESSVDELGKIIEDVVS